MRLIGLMGAEQVGKSTAAAFLRDKGFQTVSFAGPLKSMLEALGLSFQQLHGCQKETPSAILCGKTARHAMQTLGTEWGRECIGEDIWVEAFKRNLLEQEAAPLKRSWDGAIPTKTPGLYMIEDVRFDNEVQAIRQLGGEIWLIRRPDVEPDMGTWARFLRWIGLKPRLHPSSTGWSRMKSPDRMLWNGGDKEEFGQLIAGNYVDWRYDHILRGDVHENEEELALDAVVSEIVEIDDHDEQKIRFAAEEMRKAFGQEPGAPSEAEAETVDVVEPEPEMPAADPAPAPIHQECIVAVLKPIHLGEVSPEVKAQDEAIAQAMLTAAVAGASLTGSVLETPVEVADREIASDLPTSVPVEKTSSAAEPEAVVKPSTKKNRRRRR